MMKHSRTILIVAGAMVIALLGLLFIRNLIDFPVYYAAGRSLLGGRVDLYSADFAVSRVMDYRYPPLFLVLLAPLWLVPYSIASYIWYLLSAAEIMGCVYVIIRTFPELRSSWRGWILIALGAASYFVMALHYGNAHLLATFLLFASLYGFLQGRAVVSGLFMALAITIKVTPVLLLPYFVLKRKWKLLAAVTLFLVILNLLPAAYFGVRLNNELLVGWYRHVVASQEFHEDNGPINLSLKGQLRRHLTSVDYSKRVDGDVQYPAVNITAQSREGVDLVWAIITVVLFVVVLLVYLWGVGRSEAAGIGREGGEEEKGIKGERESGRKGVGREIAAHELSLMICLMLLVGPLTSKIYFIALLWPVANLASLALNRNSRAARVSMFALCVVALANLVLPLLPGRSIQRLLLVLGIDFYLTCLVMAALLLNLVTRYRAFLKRSGEQRKRVLSEARTP